MLQRVNPTFGKKFLPLLKATRDVQGPRRVLVIPAASTDGWKSSVERHIYCRPRSYISVKAVQVVKQNFSTK